MSIKYINEKYRFCDRQKNYLDKDKIIYSLNKYLHGLKVDNKQMWFGNYVYDGVDKMLDNSMYDIHSFHCLYDHKKVMKTRIKYLHEMGVLHNITKANDLCMYLEQETLKCRNLIIKLVISKNINIANKLKNMYQNIKEVEKILYEELISLITNV